MLTSKIKVVINCCSHLNIICLNLMDFIMMGLEYFLFNDILMQDMQDTNSVSLEEGKNGILLIYLLVKHSIFIIQRRQNNNVVFCTKLKTCIVILIFVDCDY